MTQETDRAKALRECGLVESGVEPSFELLARLAVGVTRAPMCVLAFGDDPTALIKACSGPPELAPTEILSGPLYQRLLNGDEEALALDDVAGAVVRAPSGPTVGVWVARTASPRVWTEDALDALKAIASLTQTELALRARQSPDEPTARILERITDACVFLDRDFRYTYVNRKAGEIFGRDPQSLVGKHIWTEFPEGVGQPFDLAYREALRSQVPSQVEEYYPPWNRWFENRIYPSPDGIAIFFQDVTDRKRAEDARRHDALLRTQAERMAHLGSWVWNIAENRAVWSDELFRIHGVSRGSFEPSFEEYLTRVHPLDRARVRDTVEDALRRRASVTFEERIVRPNGEVRYLNSWGSVSVGPDGSPTEMYGASLDMTELIVATKGLQRTEAWLVAALESTRIAVWDWNVRTNDVTWSSGAERAFGLRPAALGTAFDAYLDYVHPDDRNALVEGLRQSVAQGSTLDAEHRVVAADGAERWAIAHGTAFPDETGRTAHVVGTIVDVTDRHRAQQERFRLLEELRHAQKMEAIGRLAAGVTHDFNNFLTVIQGSAEVLLASGNLDPSAREIALGIIQTTEHASELTKQLAAFARRRRLDPSSLDLNQVVETASSILRRLLPRDVELVLSLAPDLARVHVAHAALEQVLLNLVSNARDAMPEGGTLTIATRPAGESVELEVRDTGVGMTEEVRARLFEPFFTTKREGQGTGLGLAIVYGIVTGSLGTIDVKSEPGVGSSFIVRLPTVQPTPGSPG